MLVRLNIMATAHAIIAGSQLSSKPDIPLHQLNQEFPVIAPDDKDDSDYSNFGVEDVDSEKEISDDEEQEEVSEDEETSDEAEEDSDFNDIVDSEAESTDDGEDESLDGSTAEESDHDHASDNGVSEDDSEADKSNNGSQQQVPIQPVVDKPQALSITEAARRKVREVGSNQKVPIEMNRDPATVQVLLKSTQASQVIVRSQQQRDVPARQQFNEQQRMQSIQQLRGQGGIPPDLVSTQVEDEEEEEEYGDGVIEELEEEEGTDEDDVGLGQPFHAQVDGVAPQMQVHARNEAFSWQLQQQMQAVPAHRALEERLVDEEEDAEDIVQEEEQDQVQHLHVQAQRQTMARERH